MSLRIYNTLTRGLEDFSPIEPGHVRMYVCGMTIYDLCHIGHARMMMAFDVAQRWLKVCGYRVTYVRNITDIDDKIIRRAVERGISIRALTDEMIAAMQQDIGALGIEPPTLEPRATEYVPQMLAMIKTLQAKGYAYQSGAAGDGERGDVNYAVRKFDGYGKLSGKSIDELRAGERVAVLDGKQDPLDFVLWKSAKDSEPEDAKWASDYGPGRPGWHIECSAMSCQTLGETFDIHGGGADLQFPHHENEIAQSEAANGKPLARFWMHNGFVRVDNEKMSKSLGNFFTIREVLEKRDPVTNQVKYPPETIRFFIVRSHYRNALNYSDWHLEDANVALRRLYSALASVLPGSSRKIDWTNPYAERFKTAMDNDFGTPEAIAILFELAREINRNQTSATIQAADLSTLLRNLGGCLGLLHEEPRRFLNPGPQSQIEAMLPRFMRDAQEAQERYVEGLITQRTAAKAAKNFAEADSIRQELLASGIVLKDSPTGTTWEAKA